MNNDKDFELVEKFNAGNDSAFELIAKKYQKTIYWHARRMLGNHMDADEVSQEVLILLYKKLKTFRFQSALSTWIYKITSTRSFNFIKKRKIKNMLSFDDPGSQKTVDGIDIIRDIENKEKLEKIQKYLNKLPVKQREVFIFRNYEELSYDEISKITGKSVGALKANYFHALKKVMELMNE